MDPMDGEIWQDAEGTLMCYTGEPGLWWVFGLSIPVSEDNPKVVHPLTRVFDIYGNACVDKLAYPDGFAFISIN